MFMKRTKFCMAALPALPLLAAFIVAFPDTTHAQSVSSDACTATGNKIRIAKRNYARACPSLPREDCDPLRDGGWICSSQNITGVTANPDPIVKPDPIVDPDPVVDP